MSGQARFAGMSLPSDTRVELARVEAEIKALRENGRDEEQLDVQRKMLHALLDRRQELQFGG